MALVLFSVLSFLCLVSGDALFYTLGSSVQGFLLGVFGIYAFFVLIDLALWGLKLASGKSVISKKIFRKYFIVRVIIVCVFAILHLAISHNGDIEFGDRIAEVYENGLKGFEATSVAGIFGTLLTSPFVALASYFGTYFLFGVTIILCLLYLFGKNIFGKFSGKKPQQKPKKSVKKPAAAKDDDLPREEYEPYFFNENGEFSKKSKKEISSGVVNRLEPFAGKFYFKDDISGADDEHAHPVRKSADHPDSKIDLKKRKDSVGSMGRDFSDYGIDDKKIGDYGKKAEVSEPMKRDAFAEGLDESESDKRVYTVPFDKGETKLSDLGGASYRGYGAEDDGDGLDDYGDYGGHDDHGGYNDEKDLRGDDMRVDGGYYSERYDDDIDPYGDVLAGGEDDLHEKRAEFKDFERDDVGDDEAESASKVGAFAGTHKYSQKFTPAREEEKDYAEEDADGDSIENMPSDYAYNPPPIALLEEYTQDPQKIWEEQQHQRWCCDTIVKVIKSKKNIDVTVERVIMGPAVTRYDIGVPEPYGPSDILQLRQDLAFRLQTGGELRMYSVPYSSYIGIEIANKEPRTIGLKASLLSEDYAATQGKNGLFFVFGEDLLGKTIVMNLNAMPHLLVCGTTGSGKSVCLNVMLASLMFRYSPAELRMIIVDPKAVEFQNYKGAPHLIFNEILGNDDRTISVLEWCVEEMERRYKTIAGNGCKDIFEYNKKTEGQKMPCILVLIDEYADFVNAQQNNKKKIELCIDRLAAKARAAGISLVIAMQRASASIISGAIKTNIVSRICFLTGSGVDSRVILDEQGAEKLLGKGDALYRVQGSSNLKRGQGAFMSNDEAKKVLDYVIENNKCYYDNKLLQAINNSVLTDGDQRVAGRSSRPDEVDEDYRRALRFAIMRQVVSGSSLRTTLRIGYNKSASIINWMEKMGYISPILENRMRKVLFTREDYEETYGEFIEDDF